MEADIISCLCEKYLREKLTVEERANLLIDIDGALEWYSYDDVDPSDAIKAIKRRDKESIKREMRSNK